MSRSLPILLGKLFALVALSFLIGGSASAICVDNDGDGYGQFGDPSCPAGITPDGDDFDFSINPGAA
jgi:hypothetical protein